MKNAALRALCGAAVTLGLLALPGVASATDGSYIVPDAGWTQPTFHNQGVLLNGSTISPPAGIPAGAVITHIYGVLTWNQNAPSGTYYEASLCDTTSVCASSWHELGQQAYGDTTQFAGYPADTTQFYVAAKIHCSCTFSFPAVTPIRYTIYKELIVYYTY